MKLTELLSLLIVIAIGATIANLIALKIAADQLQKQAGNSSLGKILGAFSGSGS